MGGRHRKPRKPGLPPLLSAVVVTAVIATALVLARPDDVPDYPFVLPAPTPAAQPPTPTSIPPTTTTPAETTPPTSTFELIVPPLTTARRTPSAAPTTRPAPTPAQPEPEGSPKCNGLGVKPQAKAACQQIMAAVPGVTVVGGLGLRPGNPTSCHPLGLALDFMTYQDKALGDRLYDYIYAHKQELGVTTLLWRVARHWDHVHASLGPCFH